MNAEPGPRRPRSLDTIAIGSRTVGSGAPVYVIAEAGVNHDGSLDLAHQLIDTAACAGVDAVKLQAFVPAELCRPDAPLPAYAPTQLARNQYEMLERLALPLESLAELQSHAVEVGLEFLCSAFDVPSLEALHALGVAAYKFASTEIDNLPLLLRAASLGRPLLLSTGTATLAEIDDTVSALAEYPVLLFHCISSYPTATSDARLSTIPFLRARYGVPVGYSDHTLGTEVACLAVAAGAVAIEKHFTLDPGRTGPDHAMSLGPDELCALVAGIRHAELVRGQPRLEPLACELNVKAVARKSLVAARALAAGTTLAITDLASHRPGGGIAPSALASVIGRVLRVSLAAGDQLHWDMLW